jgi:hypothetical protein
MEIIIILIVILVVFYFCYLNSKNNKLTKTEAFDGPIPQAILHGPASALSASSSDPTSNHDYVTMYEHINFGGSTLNLGVGETSFETLNILRWNDKASSIKVPRGLRAVFYEHGGRGGEQLSLSAGDYPNLVNMGWNDRISCVDVFKV